VTMILTHSHIPHLSEHLETLIPPFGPVKYRKPYTYFVVNLIN